MGFHDGFRNMICSHNDKWKCNRHILHPSRRDCLSASRAVAMIDGVRSVQLASVSSFGSPASVFIELFDP